MYKRQILPEIIEAAEGDLLTILRLGTAGSLQPYVRGGHLHIPTASIRDEGSSQAVIGLEFPATASPELIPILVLASERHGYRLGENLWLGPVHTKDNLYFRETPHFSPRRELLKQRLSAFREMGALSSEMEFSTYCILRDYYEGKIEKRILTGCILAVVNDFEEAEERSFFWRLTGRENLRFYAALYHLPRRQAEERISELLEMVGLAEEGDIRFQNYSTGMRQKLAIARGLLSQPRVLFVDEPTRSLDPVSAEAVRQFLKEKVASEGKTVVLATHNLVEAEQLCNRLAIMDLSLIHI